MAVKKTYDTLASFGRIAAVVDCLDVLPHDELERDLSSRGIRIVSPFHVINDESYAPVSALEKELEKKFGRGGGANDSDDCCTVEFGSAQVLLVEHAGQYRLSDWVLDVRSGQMKDLQTLVTDNFRTNFSLSTGGGRVDGVFPIQGTFYCLVNWSSFEGNLGFRPAGNYALTDREGEFLALDRGTSPIGEGSVFVLDDRILVVRRDTQEHFELPRNFSFYNAILNFMSPGLRADLAGDYVDKHTTKEAGPDGPLEKFSGSEKVRDCYRKYKSVHESDVTSLSRLGLLRSLQGLPKAEKENLFADGLRKGLVSFEELHRLAGKARKYISVKKTNSLNIDI